jgi:hypothetical protein
LLLCDRKELTDGQVSLTLALPFCEIILLTMKFLVAVALATIASVQAGCFPEGVRPPTLSYEEKVRKRSENASFPFLVISGKISF